MQHWTTSAESTCKRGTVSLFRFEDDSALMNVIQTGNNLTV